MSGFELRDQDDGTVELVEIVPTVIATFMDRTHAERYFGILVENRDAIAPPPQRPGVLGKTASKLVTRHAATPPTVKVTTPDSPAKEITDPDWDAAFQAVVEGGDMQKIASALGVDFNKMRGKYAAWKRHRKASATQAPTVPDADMESCRLCEKEFAANSSADGLCARCSRG